LKPHRPNGALCSLQELQDDFTVASGKGRVVGGEGKEAEIDGRYFGGYVKAANLKAISP